MEPELNIEKEKKYEVSAMKDSTIYAKAAESQILRFYYLVFWKGYSKDEST